MNLDIESKLRVPSLPGIVPINEAGEIKLVLG
jgi:hypothetical protein